MKVNTVFKNVDEIMSLYTNYGNDVYIEKSVSQVEHMCQCAMLAQLNCYDNELILAAFFHDIGHLLEPTKPLQTKDGYGIADHQKIGASYLTKKGFSERISKLVASPLPAKRYLAYKCPEYYNQLSPASKKNLELHGGIMSADEASKFESEKYFKSSLLLCKWDEEAKQIDVPLPDLNIYKKKMVEHLMYNF